MDRETRIRDRAYRIWEEEGRPDGKAEEHWERALRIVEDEDSTAGADRPVRKKKPASSRPPRKRRSTSPA